LEGLKNFNYAALFEKLFKYSFKLHSFFREKIKAAAVKIYSKNGWARWWTNSFSPKKLLQLLSRVYGTMKH